jgi:hypothetical protein
VVHSALLVFPNLIDFLRWDDFSMDFKRALGLMALILSGEREDEKQDRYDSEVGVNMRAGTKQMR